MIPPLTVAVRGPVVAVIFIASVLSFTLLQDAARSLAIVLRVVFRASTPPVPASLSTSAFKAANLVVSEDILPLLPAKEEIAVASPFVLLISVVRSLNSNTASANFSTLVVEVPETAATKSLNT